MSNGSRLALPAPWAASFGSLRARWQGMALRERRMLGLAGLVLGAFLVWTVGIQPAWRTLREAPARLDALDLQTQGMRALATEALQLRDAPALSPEQSAQALRSASERLGAKARLTVQGDRAVLTVNGLSSGQLREWLAEARAGARARPIEAQLTRGAQGFNGSIVVGLGGGG